MSDFVTRFITALVNGGIIPKKTNEIRETDRFRRLAAESDKGGKRSISYWLKIEHDFAYGYARDFKTGVDVRFKSYNDDPNLSRNDMTRIKKLLKARQAEEEVRIADRQAKIALRAAARWSECAVNTPTPYTEIKRVEPLSARAYGRTLIVPMYDNMEGGIVNYQSIEADGKKRFPFGGKKQGCWHVIGQIDPTRPIVICEGWATGASIHMATGSAVVVGFDKDNMLPVAKWMRGHYTNTPIVIAGDNDISGAGQVAAEKIRKTVSGVQVVLPPEPGADFNDLPHDEILKLMASAISPSPDGLNAPEKSNSVQTVRGNWESNLTVDAKGRMVSSSLKNAAIYLSHHEDWKDIFKYDEFKNSIMVVRQPPWDDKEQFKAATLSDVIIIDTAITLESYGIMLGRDKVAQAIESVANQNKFHSARVYFNALEWDGTPRLETMFIDHFGCTQEAPEYLSFVGKKWMTAAIKRIMQPGCKFDHVLILESSLQGVSKSSALKCLVTFGEDESETYHTDAVSISDIQNPHTALKLQGSMIVELAELKGFSKQDDEGIKNWITQQFDEIKLPYDRFTSRYKRQFVFAATTNKHDYLKDPTGNRRYWPITVERVIDLDYLASEREQLWAEAVHYWKQGLYIGPTPEENELAEVERNKRLSQDPWEDKILEIAAVMPEKFKVSNILDMMPELRLTDKNEATARKIAGILQMNGFKNKVCWNGAKSERMWLKK